MAGSGVHPMWHGLITPRTSNFAESCHEPFAPSDQRARDCRLGWMDAGLLAKAFQDLISSAFSSCQTSSLLRTEGGFFTLVLLNCDAPRMLQRISRTGKIIHRCISCCTRCADTAQEGLGLQQSSGCTLPLLLLCLSHSECSGQVSTGQSLL